MLSVKEERNKEVTTSGVDLERQIMFFICRGKRGKGIQHRDKHTLRQKGRTQQGTAGSSEVLTGYTVARRRRDGADTVEEESRSQMLKGPGDQRN